jgi:hypothetical protein
MAGTSVFGKGLMKESLICDARLNQHTFASQSVDSSILAQCIAGSLSYFQLKPIVATAKQLSRKRQAQCFLRASSLCIAQASFISNTIVPVSFVECRNSQVLWYRAERCEDRSCKSKQERNGTDLTQAPSTTDASFKAVKEVGVFYGFTVLTEIGLGPLDYFERRQIRQPMPLYEFGQRWKGPIYIAEEKLEFVYSTRGNYWYSFCKETTYDLR